MFDLPLNTAVASALQNVTGRKLSVTTLGTDAAVNVLLKERRRVHVNPIPSERINRWSSSVDYIHPCRVRTRGTDHASQTEPRSRDGIPREDRNRRYQVHFHRRAIGAASLAIRAGRIRITQSPRFFWPRDPSHVRVS